jgi:hypothetical protein
MPDQLEGIVQRLMDEGGTDDDIKAVIQEWKGREAGEKANLSRVLGRKETPKDFKLPSQKSITPTLTGPDRPKRPEEIGAESEGYMGKDPDLGARGLRRLPGIAGAVTGTAATIGTGGMGPVAAYTLPPIASGGAAYLGARARGDSRADAAMEGLTNTAAGLVVPPIVKAPLAAGRYLTNKGLDVARGYLKPTLAAGRKEAMRLFGRPTMASTANEEVVKRALERNILGAKNPEMAISEAIDAAEGKLGKLVGDQPTRLNDYLNTVFQRGVKAAKGSARDVPGALGTIENEMARTRSGSLGPKLDFGESIPPGPTPSGNVSTAALLEKMKGTQPTAVVPHRPQPVTAKEALQFARRSAKDTSWDKPSSSLLDWFTKQQESAARTAVKQAVPEARPHLKELGELISLQRVVPQAMNRELNKNTVARLPAMIAAAAQRSPKNALMALLGVNMADQNAGKVAQTLYNVGKKIPGVSPQNAEAASRMAQTMLLSLLADAQAPETPAKP